MKVTLIDPSISSVSIGARTISAYLKQNGHKVKMVFLPVAGFYTNPDYKYPDSVIDEVIKVAKGSGLVGFSLLTNFMLQGLQVTKRIEEELGVPIIWGGAHPTIKPEECIKHADMVCVGEGEEAVLDVANRIESGKRLDNIPNIWHRSGRKVTRNAPRPLESNLDKYPFLDYDIEDHYIMREGKLRQLDEKLFKEVLDERSVRDTEGNVLYTYWTIASRGCPHSCAYCCNNALRKVYGQPKNYVRRRSVENMMQELEGILERYPYMGYVRFFDDTFMATTTEELVKFATEYKKRIDLPFSCVTSPVTILDAKMKPLIEAGLTQMEMGVQTGSERVNREVYKRNITNEQVVNAARIINKYKDNIRPRFDVIMDNPYETLDDQLETARLLSRLPKPFRLSTFSLTFFPGTELYDRAHADGIVRDDVEDVYKKCYLKSSHVEGLSFADLLIMNSPFMPGWLTRLLANKRVAGAASNKLVRRAVNGTYSLGRKAYQRFVGVDYWRG